MSESRRTAGVLVAARGLELRFARGKEEIAALRDVELELRRGELAVLRGPSGCGKTTLLLTLGGMLRPSAGRVVFDGLDLYAAAETERNALRARRVGFVFQTMHLLPYLDVVANVALALRGATARGDRARIVPLLEELGLSRRLAHRPPELSAGERQRVALARALVHDPELILADEPTGNLDPQSAGLVLERLAAFHRDGGTVLLVTHERELPVAPTRELSMAEGRVAAAPPVS